MGIASSSTVLAQVIVDLELIVMAVVLLALLGLGVYLVAAVRRWRQEAKAQSAPPLTLEDYRVLLEQGLLEPLEFERIRAILEKRTAQPPPTANSTGIQAALPSDPEQTSRELGRDLGK